MERVLHLLLCLDCAACLCAQLACEIRYKLVLDRWLNDRDTGAQLAKRDIAKGGQKLDSAGRRSLPVNSA